MERRALVRLGVLVLWLVLLSLVARLLYIPTLHRHYCYFYLRALGHCRGACDFPCSLPVEGQTNVGYLGGGGSN